MGEYKKAHGDPSSFGTATTTHLGFRQGFQCHRQSAHLPSAQSLQKQIPHNGIGAIRQAQLSQQGFNLVVDTGLLRNARQPRVVFHVRTAGEEPVQAIVLRYKGRMTRHVFDHGIGRHVALDAVGRNAQQRALAAAARSENGGDAAFGKIHLHGVENGLAVLAMLGGDLFDNGVAVIGVGRHGWLVLFLFLMVFCKSEDSKELASTQITAKVSSTLVGFSLINANHCKGELHDRGFLFTVKTNLHWMTSGGTQILHGTAFS